MSDDDKSVDELRAKAALAVAKHAAQQALPPSTWKKRIIQVAIGSLVAVGLLGLMFHFWYWSLLLGFVGVAGLYGRHRWRTRRALRERSKAPEAPTLKARIEEVATPAPAEEADDASVDDDLAALKARLKR